MIKYSHYTIKNLITTILVIILCVAQLGCSVKWSQAIKQGDITPKSFNQIISIDVQKSLIFIPVTIEGKEYRFLFDTGAPLSISKKLQEKFVFKKISSSRIVDSDNNKKTVTWARVDKLKIGELTYSNQTAFVGDFEANPIIKCLKIDGIIGSNLIRQSNWIINQEEKTISITNQSITQKGLTIPFKTDKQFNMFINLKIGEATLQNVLVDYGSNQTLSLSSKIYNLLEQKNILTKSKTEVGEKKTGIIGKPTPINRKFTYAENVQFADSTLQKTVVQSGRKTTIGNQLLARFIVSIDWEQKQLILQKRKSALLQKPKRDFSLAKNDEDILIQSVVIGSEGYKKGIRPKMKVVQIDDLNFQNGNTFCDYVNHHLTDKTKIHTIDSLGKELVIELGE